MKAIDLSRLPPWVPESVRQEPKKAATLGALTLLLMILALRWMLGSESPAAALASLPASKAAGEVLQKSLATDAHEAPLLTRQWLIGPVAALDRNLFALKTEYFPRSASYKASPKNKVIAHNFWDTIQKSRDEAADERIRRATLVDNLQREAARLHLQSTVMGPAPQAIIGGSLVNEGDVVASSGDANSISFRVLKIEARRVVIEREGIRLELRMKQ
jgi:hypothetical protein